MADLLWLLALPVALAVDWALDEDTRSAIVSRLRRKARAPADGPSDDAPAIEEHRRMLTEGLRCARLRWVGHVERGFPELAADDKKTIDRISREIRKLPATTEPTLTL